MMASAQGTIFWVLQNLLPFILLVTPVVFFHELGHFSVARFFGVKVETFSIGFGPAIVKWHDRTGTLWKISWIPLGGYVKFLGDLNAVSMPDEEQLEQMPLQDRAIAFPFKPLYQRALIVAAGPAANFLLSMTILTTFLLIFGGYVVTPLVNKVVTGSAAEAAGVRAGDVIVSIAGQAIHSFDDIPQIVWDRAGQNLAVDVRRGNKLISLHVTPRLTTVKNLGETLRVGTMGISNSGSPTQVTHVYYGPIGAIGEAGRETWSYVSTTFDFLLRRFTFRLGADQIRGPIGIAQISAQVAAISYLSLVKLAAFISISLGLINLFPIPVLDGGHLLYYAFEALLGRPLGARAQDVGFRLGLALMLGFFLFATWNDLARLLKP
jgi:regulator of sigma E protease